MKPLLVDAKYIEQLLGYSMSAIKTANMFYGFPCPVMKISNRYQWRLSDVERWVECLGYAFDKDGKALQSNLWNYGFKDVSKIVCK